MDAAPPNTRLSTLSMPEIDSGLSPLVFIHGWGCDRSFLAPQHRHFAATRTCLSVDLPGHGDGPANHDDYGIPALARYVADICIREGMEAPVLIGHSLGGSVALECAANACSGAKASVMVDTYLFPPSNDAERSEGAEAIAAYGIEAVLPDLHAMLMAPEDDDTVWDRFAASISATDCAVLASCLRGLHAYNPDAALRDGPPSAYIAAERIVVDEARLTLLQPGVRIGRVRGAGHFAPLLVPEQVNAMLAGFLAQLERA